MRIDKIHIEGFRGINELDLDLNKGFNLFIGENGSGKTAILEALCVGMGCYFSGMAGVSARHIRSNDIRYFKTPEGSYEYVASTIVDIKAGVANNETISWFKQKDGVSGSNVMGKKSKIRLLSEKINKSIKDPKRITNIDLPVLAYYSTGRLWKEGRHVKDEDENKENAKKLPSRYRGYKDALEAKSSFKDMLDWFKGKYSDRRVSGKSTFQLDCVETALKKNIEGAQSFTWSFDKDKLQTLYIMFENEVEIPFSFLSDGYRNMFAIFADLAYRCVTLNPHFGVQACSRSEGMVLIDEIDLHLHPSWQKTIVKQLKETFPKIQFVATTHSPFIIQEVENGELFILTEKSGNVTSKKGGGDDSSLEDIAEFIQNVPNPSWSIKKMEMYDAAKEYFTLLNSMEKQKSSYELDQIRERLNIIGKAYSTNVAYTAFLEQKRILAEQKINN